MRIVLGILFIILTVGLIEAAAVLGGTLLAGDQLPNWPVWRYLISAFAVGSLYLLAELVFHPITTFLVDTDRVDHPLWKRSLRVLGIIVVVCVVAAMAGIAASSCERSA